MTASREQMPLRTKSAVVELRQYTLHRGQRDALIELFEREFIEPQERTGMEIIGLFRERNDPDLFVWLRGFPTIEARRDALEAFYTSTTWATHRDAANATMIDSDNVLLLRPAWGGSGFNSSTTQHQRPSELLYVASVYALDALPERGFLEYIHHELLPLAVAAGAASVAEMVTEPSPNTFPRLPVREGEQVFVWFARFPSATAYEHYCTQLEQSKAWRSVVDQLDRWNVTLAQVLELIPTRRSALA